MSSNTFHLRPYQEIDVNRFLDIIGNGGICCQCPEGCSGSGTYNFVFGYGTGGGKTLTALTMASSLLIKEFIDLVLFVVPTKVLRSQVISDQGKTIKWSQDQVVIEKCQEVKSGAEFRSSLDHLERGCMLVMTYNVLIANHHILSNNFDMGRTLLVLDEAHHAPAEKEPTSLCLGDLALKLQGLGVKTMRLTGTPYRTDKFDVVGNSHVARRSLAELTVWGYAPSKIESEVVVVEGGAVEDTGGNSVEATVAAPTNINGAAAAILRTWQSDGKPPAIVRVKPSNSRELNQARVASISHLLGPENVIDATGKDSDSLLTAMEKEREARKKGNPCAQNIIVGIQRVTEGLDSVSRAVGYMWGIPKSMQLLEQFLGRLMRLKTDYKKNAQFSDYPKKWLDRSKLYFLVGGLDDPYDTHRQYLFKALVLANSLEYASFIASFLDELEDGIHNPPSGPRGDIAIEVGLSQEDLAAAEEIVCEVEAIFSTSALHSQQYSINFLDFDLAKAWANEKNYEIDPKALRKVIRNRLVVGYPGATKEMVRITRDKLKRNKDLRINLDQLLEEVYEDFCSEVHTSDPSQLKTSAENWRHCQIRVNNLVENKLTKLPQTKEELFEVVDTFLQENGRFPGKKDKILGYEFAALYPKVWSWGKMRSLLVAHYAQSTWQETAHKIYNKKKAWEDLSKEHPDLKERLRKPLTEQFPKEVEAVYFPDAVLAWSACQTFARDLSLQQAEKIGRLPKTEQRKLRSLHKKIGTQNLLEHLDAL